ncbi:MAG: hypothetical protein AB7O28_10450 [Vicinamibacterales bacterium]
MELLSRRTALAPPPALARQASRRRVIRTLSGERDPADLSGSVLFQEHPSMRYPLDATAHVLTTPG